MGPIRARPRRSRRINLEQLADALGVNVKSVDNWENGRNAPRSSVGALEDVLGISLSGDDSRTLTKEELEERLQRAERAFRAEIDELRSPSGNGKRAS